MLRLQMNVGTRDESTRVFLLLIDNREQRNQHRMLRRITIILFTHIHLLLNIGQEQQLT